MNRSAQVLFLTAVLLSAPLAVNAAQTCESLPQARADSAGWELSDQDREAVSNVLDQAEALCAEGKEDEADTLLKEAKHQSIRDWRTKMEDSSH